MGQQAAYRTLICVLDWGIGHASRSLALAHQLRSEGDTVHFAAAGNALKMLEKEVDSGTVIHQLPAYNIDYRSSNMIVNIGIQLPKIIATVFKEQKALAAILKANAYDRIISDSRFGCYSRDVPTIMLTHQMQPIFGVPVAGWCYRKYLLRHFDEFWIPDLEGTSSLSGKLSSATGYHNVRHIGPLSRLQESTSNPALQYDVFCLLSGPEPQRSYLEKALFELLQTIPGRHLIVAGKPAINDEMPDFQSASTRIERLAFTAASQTALLLRQSKTIICRSGYSTLMDLDKLDIKNIILIPTPGQTEQIYLAKYWAAKGRARWVEQKQLKNILRINY